MALEIPAGIYMTNPKANVDEHYGPWESVAAALAGVPAAIRMEGRTVGIIDPVTRKVTEYWWQGGTTNDDLVEKGMSREELASIIQTMSLSPIVADDSGVKPFDYQSSMYSQIVHGTNLELGPYYKNTGTEFVQCGSESGVYVTLNDSAVVLNDESLFYYFTHGYRYQRIKVGEVGVYGRIKTPTSGENGVELILCPTGTQTGKFANTPCIYFYDDDAPFVQEGERVIYVCTLENIVLKTNAAEEYIVADDTVEITDIVDGTTPDGTYDIIFPTTKYICTQSQTASTAPFWTYLFTVENITLTDAQFESINSTATLDKINMIQTNANAIAGIKTGQSINDFAAVESALASTGVRNYLIKDEDSQYDTSLHTLQGENITYGGKIRNSTIVLGENSTAISSNKLFISGSYSTAISSDSNGYEGGSSIGGNCNVVMASRIFNIYPTIDKSVILASESAFMSGSSGQNNLKCNAIIASFQVGIGQYGTPTQETDIGCYNVAIGVNAGSSGMNLKGTTCFVAGTSASGTIHKSTVSSSVISYNGGNSLSQIYSKSSVILASSGSPIQLGSIQTNGVSSESSNGVICTTVGGSLNVLGSNSGTLFMAGSGVNITGSQSAIICTNGGGNTIVGNNDTVISSDGGGLQIAGNENSMISTSSGGNQIYGNKNIMASCYSGNHIGTSSTNVEYNAFFALSNGGNEILYGKSNIIAASDSGGNKIYGSSNTIIASGGGNLIGTSTGTPSAANYSFIFASPGSLYIYSGSYNTVGSSASSYINSGQYNSVLGSNSSYVSSGQFNGVYNSGAASIQSGSYNFSAASNGVSMFSSYGASIASNGCTIRSGYNTAISSTGSVFKASAGSGNTIISAIGSTVENSINNSVVLSSNLTAVRNNTVYSMNIDNNGNFNSRILNNVSQFTNPESVSFVVSDGYARAEMFGSTSVIPSGMSNCIVNNTLTVYIGDVVYSGTIKPQGFTDSWFIGNLYLFDSNASNNSGESFYIGKSGANQPVQLIVSSSLAGTYSDGDISFSIDQIKQNSHSIIGENNYLHLGVTSHYGERGAILSEDTGCYININNSQISMRSGGSMASHMSSIRLGVGVSIDSAADSVDIFTGGDFRVNNTHVPLKISDWGESDSNDDAFVKNRTHYSTIYDDKTLTSAYPYGEYDDIMLDGVAYMWTGLWSLDIREIGIPSSVTLTLDSTDISFDEITTVGGNLAWKFGDAFIRQESSGCRLLIVNDGVNVFPNYVELTIDGEAIFKLDEKYIPVLTEDEITALLV